MLENILITIFFICGAMLVYMLSAKLDSIESKCKDQESNVLRLLCSLPILGVCSDYIFDFHGTKDIDALSLEFAHKIEELGKNLAIELTNPSGLKLARRGDVFRRDSKEYKKACALGMLRAVHEECEEFAKKLVVGGKNEQKNQINQKGCAKEDGKNH